MRPTILDLDEPGTWNESLRQVVYDDSTWPVLLTDYHAKGEKYQQLHHEPSDVSDPFVRTLRNRCENLVRTCYTHVAAYHACCTDDPARYHKHGILTSSHERLTGNAKKLFSGIPGLETALAACDSYFQTYDCSVSLYSTSRFAPTYLSGSHYLTIVAQKLGKEAQARLQPDNAKGQSVFIKCVLPISWFDDLGIIREPSLYRYATSLMRRLIVMKADGVDDCADNPFALVVFCPVPMENVVSITPAQPVASEL